MANSTGKKQVTKFCNVGTTLGRSSRTRATTQVDPYPESAKELEQKRTNLALITHALESNVLEKMGAMCKEDWLYAEVTRL